MFSDLNWLSLWSFVHLLDLSEMIFADDHMFYVLYFEVETPNILWRKEKYKIDAPHPTMWYMWRKKTSKISVWILLILL